MHRTVPLSAIALLAFALGACSTPPRQAASKTVQVQNKKLEFGGVYDEDKRHLRITINGEPMLQGDFSRYSPTLTLNTRLDALDVSAQCYFGSILNKGPGGLASQIVANSVQGKLGKSADTCEMLVGDKKVETLYF